ncbi:het domain-containing protein [Colletotrichum camelliae]|nr:het domain-containing protein [Colletotrichum camelliae]
MDHLPLPRDPINEHPVIKLATAQFHNPGPFLDYPDRHGALLSGQYPHVPTQADALQGRFSAGVSSYNVLDYYQGWLFFALIKEFLGDEDEYDARKKIMSFTFDDDGQLSSAALSTKSLHKDLTAWRETGRLSSIRRGDEYHKHLDECLETAFQALDSIDSRFPGFLRVFRDEMICLAGVAETLDVAVQTALEHGPVAEMNHDEQYFPARPKYGWFSTIAPLLDPLSPETKRAMVNAGWCPGDIGKIRDTFTSIEAFYYLQNFKADSTVADLHKDCREYGCNVRIPAVPKHESPGCECPGMMTFEEEHLIEIYQKGDIPCFAIGRLEDGGLGVALTSISIDEESQKDPENHYVALSHVWSEGMGNVQANALPFCQLAYVMHWSMMAYQVVEDKLQEEETTGTGINVQTKPKVRQINLWIDTMCCPATPGYGKNLCLSRMREIYANAYAVLVKSAVLQATSVRDIFEDTSRGLIDVATHIYTSPWMRRMWTLQEGVLAGASRARGSGDRLCFAFRDSLLSLESVVNLLKQAPKHEASLAFRFIAEFRDLSVSMWQLPDETNTPRRKVHPLNFFLQMLVSALKHRSLTVASDEVICLATLLDLRIKTARGEVEPLIGDGETPEDGMCQLWRRVETLQGAAGLPGDIIFSCVPRVQVPGFRWAPRTLVQYAKYGNMFVSPSSPYPARIEDEGLRVRFPGAKLNCFGGLGMVGRLLPTEPRSTDENGDERGRDVEAGGETVVPRVLMIKVPTDGDQWYAVHVYEEPKDGKEDGSYPRSSGEDEESRPKAIADRHDDLVQLIRNGSVALVFRPGEVTTGPGLLVSMPKSPSSAELGAGLAMLSLNPEPLRVHSEFPVQIRPLAGPSCVIADATVRCVEGLQEAVEAEARQRGEDVAVSDVWDDQEIVTRLLRETAEGLMGSSDDLKKALYFEVLARRASSTDETALNIFLKYVRHMAYFGGGMKGEAYFEDQEWWVD